MTYKEVKKRQDQEPHLRQPEVSNTAHSLIQEFKQAIRRIPKFTLALQDQYLSEEPGKRVEDPIKFKKGDYCYQIRYTIDHERERVLVSKLPEDPDTADWTDENITLETVCAERGRFAGGSIQATKFFNEVKPEVYTNTNTAVQKVREFIKANFQST